MNDSHNPNDENPKAQMSEAANEEEETALESTDQDNADLVEITPSQTPQSIIQSSEDAWITGTKSLQRNLIRGLQEYKTGIFQIKEIALLSKKRQEMIVKVTDQYIRFLREEARLASDAALQAREVVLTKQLVELKSAMYGEIADMTGESIRAIEQIFQQHISEMTDEKIKEKYAQFVFEKIIDLLETNAKLE
jgi:hypothetical protein